MTQVAQTRVAYNTAHFWRWGWGGGQGGLGIISYLWFKLMVACGAGDFAALMTMSSVPGVPFGRTLTPRVMYATLTRLNLPFPFVNVCMQTKTLQTHMALYVSVLIFWCPCGTRCKPGGCWLLCPRTIGH